MFSVISLLITAISILQLLIIVRIILSYFPAARYNPVASVICAIVDPILAPFRRILPTFAGIDFSPMLAILVLYAISRVLTDLQYGTLSVSGALGFIVVELILGILIFFCVLLLIRILMSALHAAPFHPLVLFVRQVTNPLVRPFASLAPRRHGLDIEAVIAFIAYVALYIIARFVLGRLI
ncbi:MAG: YggT family protein [Candidatus Dormibacteria bacterium]